MVEKMEIRETLKKQMQLLSKRSHETTDDSVLSRMTDSMVALANVLSLFF